MAPAPLEIDPQQRALLPEFERRYERWCVASAAAERAERELARQVREHELGRAAAPAAAALQQVLVLSAEAARLQQEALQLLRDAPL